MQILGWVSKFSVQFSYLAVSDSLWPHGLQSARLPYPSQTPGAYSVSCPFSWWCDSTISSSVVPFSFCRQSSPASGSFQMSRFFTSGGQIIGASASAAVLSMNIQVWFPLMLVQFSHSVVSDSLQPHELQHTRPPCPSPTPEVRPTHVHRVSDAIQPSHIWTYRVIKREINIQHTK